MSLLDVKKISKIYGQGETAVKAVDNISFRVHHGEIVLVMGPSGSGKTTLLSMVGGLLSVSTGKIILDKENINALSRKKLSEARLRDIGFVFQSFNLLQNLTAWENVRLAGELSGLSAAVAKEKAKALLERLHLSHRLHHLPSKLSGGEQQRVSIARALMNDPKIILADEPTGNLDSKSGHEVMMLFHNIAKDEKKAVVIVSHDGRIKDIADRTLWIEDGIVSAEPSQPESLVCDPVCGMKIGENYTKFLYTHNKKEYKFCSEDCLKRFRENLDKYV